MTTKNPKLEFVSDETQLTLVNQRLSGVEQEVVNAQIDLRLEQAVASTLTAPASPGYPGSQQSVDQRQSALDSAVARLEALRGIRDEMVPQKENTKG